MKAFAVSFVAVLASAVLLFAAQPAAAAASINTDDAHVPFAFWVGNQLMPAGNYIVTASSTDENTLLVENQDHHDSAFVMADQSSAPSTGGPALKFGEVGNTHFLTSVDLYGDSALRIPLSRETIASDVERSDR
jgi:hypothetical protein